MDPNSPSATPSTPNQNPTMSPPTPESDAPVATPSAPMNAAVQAALAELESPAEPTTSTVAQAPAMASTVSGANVSPNPVSAQSTAQPVANATLPPVNPTPVQPATSPTAPTAKPVTIPEPVKTAMKKTGKMAVTILTRWYFWVIVVLIGVAIGGWSFGLIEMGEHNATKEKFSVYEDEIAEKNKLLVKYGAELGIKVDQNGWPIKEETKPKDEDVWMASEYVYIGEWGMKFKIPSGLKNISYLFSGVEYYTSTVNRGTDVCATAMPAKAEGNPGFSDLRQIGWTGLGCLGRFPIEPEGDIVSDEWYAAQREAAVFEDGTYYYVYSGPQAIFSTDPEEIKLETETTELIKKMLTENYSPFREALDENKEK